ncbi:hypothetical protein JHN59_13835 [Streptomyces sp. MBT49]|uniref:hypothetical protein n=1 Tax=Streptomyces sp. MBT49 TaxID=1488380 RepID=UPI00190A590E|nr:hypothetical protein [Streptomyces sp. MBT49]MBK3625904.1 hypothetical protein [Streptomyces sp. MBT49]
MAVHTGAGRCLTAEDWLLSTLPEPNHERHRRLWAKGLISMLPLGEWFSVVKIPGKLLCAAIGVPDAPDERVDGFLARILGGRPVICDPSIPAYYAVVPKGGDLPASWHQYVAGWHPLGVRYMGRGAWVDVPGPGDVALDVDRFAPYWAVPVSTPPTPCDPRAVVHLIEVLAQAARKEASR